MELYPNCVTCVINNVIQKADKMLPDVDTKMELLKRLMIDLAPLVKHGCCAPILTGKGYDILREFTNVDDPYMEVKKEFNDIMLKLEPEYTRLIENSEDPLHTALIASGTANLIDFGAFEDVSEDTIMSQMSSCIKNLSLPQEEYGKFTDMLDKHRSLLILGDNCGEIVLDKILVRQLQRAFPDIAITYAARDRPILNDATLEDAEYVGMDKIADTVSSGSDLPGFVSSACRNNFIDFYKKQPLILAKGVGNFEGADHDDYRIFFLFMVKCRTISKNLGIAVNTLNFQHGRTNLI